MRARKRLVSSVLAVMVGLVPISVVAGTTAPASAAVGVLSHVASTSTVGARTAHTVRIPAGVASGDRLVLFLTTNSTTGTLNNAVTGWTLLQEVEGNGTRGRAWTRTATATDAGRSVTVTTSASVKSILSVAAYRSTIAPATVSASAVAADDTAGTTHLTPAVPVAGEGSVLVNYWSEKSSTATTWTLPAGSTSRTTAQGTGTGKVSGVLADNSAGIGTAAARNATTSASVSRSVNFSVVVQPGSDTTTPGNSAPAATFTSSCIGLTCTFDASASTDADNDPLSYSWNFGDGSAATGATASRTFASAGSRQVTLTVSDATASETFTRTVTVTAPAGSQAQPKPGHTRVAPQVPQRNMPLISAGEIWDIEVVGTKVYVAGGFTSARNQAAGNTTTVSQANLLKYDLGTGLIDTSFRPVFAGGGVQDVEATPDGTKIFVAGRFNTVNGVTKRKFASLDTSTGAPIAGFTADANGAGTELEATDTTLYIGGQFTTINGTPKNALAAVSAVSGALVGRTGSLPQGTFNNNITGGIGPNGALTVQELKLTHDNAKLLVVHTGRQIAGQNRYGVGIIDTESQQLTAWRTSLWEDNLGFVGGIQRIYAGDIAPDDSYFVVGSGSGGDRPPINDTIISFPLTGGDNVQPNWVSRAFDSVYSIAATERAIYFGGHFSWNESPTARDPWPGLDDVGYGTGQGLSGYSLGDDVVRRDHVGALSPSDGKAVEWNPGSNSFEGNKAMIAVPRGLITGGDATTQGGYNIGRIAFYDFNSEQLNAANETTITTPIEGRVEEAGAPFTVAGTARATSGVRQVQLEVVDGTRYLQDDLTTWGAANTINVNLANPNATATNWSLPLTVTGNRALRLQAKTFAVNGSSDATKAVKKIETFSTADRTPTTSISAPGFGQQLTSTTFTVSGTATDDFGISSLNWTMRDAGNRYLQDDGSASSTYNAFRIEPDVVGAVSTTWSFEVTVPSEGEWKLQVTPVDTAGQSSLDTIDRTFMVNSNGVAPKVTVTAPVAMTPPTAVSPVSVAPGGRMTFSGTAVDDQGLRNVEIRLSNSTTRENLTADGQWVVGQGDWYRVSAVDVTGDRANWSYTTPFNLKAGTYSFSVRATDDDLLSTSSTDQGRLTINAQVAGDAAPDGLITAPPAPPTTLSFTLNGTATDDKGVAEVQVALLERDSNRYLQPTGTMASAFATVPATLASPNATSTAWSLPVTLPVQGDWSITAYAFDTAGQQDTSTTGATARYAIYPGDTAPVVVAGLQQPSSGESFDEGKIFVSGRVEDNQQIAQAQVAVVNSAGQYMSSSGTFTSTTESWRNAFLNSPGSPGSNYSYTTPVIPAGSYTVRVRGVDQNGLTTNPSTDVTVTVRVPASNPPVASFTHSCDTVGGKPNVCTFDGRGTTDENIAGVTYAWSFGTTPATTGTGAVVTNKTFTAAGTFPVTLTAKDEWGNVSAPVTRSVTITEPTSNTAPTGLVINAPSCTGLACNFSGTYGENIGDSVTRTWSWGEGTATTVTSANVSALSSTVTQGRTYTTAGTYTVTLTVTDGWGKTATATRQVTVTSP